MHQLVSVYRNIYIYQLMHMHSYRQSAKQKDQSIEYSRLSGVNVRLDLAFLLLLSFVPHGMYGAPQIKLPTKSSLQHMLGQQTRVRNLNKNYCLPTEDVKLLRRNLCACLHEVTSSFRLFKFARSALQIMKYFFPQAQITAL